jgi:hypothetical protein
LNLIIEEAQAYTDRCNTYIGEWDKVVIEGTGIGDEGKAREYINEIIKFRDDIQGLGITCELFSKFLSLTSPFLECVETSH